MDRPELPQTQHTVHISVHGGLGGWRGGEEEGGEREEGEDSKGEEGVERKERKEGNGNGRGG